MKLTHSKLIRGESWRKWHESEWQQLEQYDTQGMFGTQEPMVSKDTVFRLVWTYNVKVLDQRKKARCACDGSTRAGQVRVLDHTYAGCVDHTSSRLFYALAAAENLLVYGADVTNAFGDAPPPKQGFQIQPDKAFHDWWTIYKKTPTDSKGPCDPDIGDNAGTPGGTTSVVEIR